MSILSMIDARTALLEDPALSEAERDAQLKTLEEQIDRERRAADDADRSGSQKEDFRPGT